MKPVLYLLSPEAAGGRFCPESAMLEGVLHYYPAIAGSIEVRRVGLARPRPELMELLGPENQSAPVLVFPKEMSGPEAASTAAGRRFLGGPEAIVRYLADAGLSGHFA